MLIKASVPSRVVCCPPHVPRRHKVSEVVSINTYMVKPFQNFLLLVNPLKWTVPPCTVCSRSISTSFYVMHWNLHDHTEPNIKLPVI